jgi:antitoxin VapB
MAFSIKDAETDRVVRALAERTGLGLTETVRVAAENELKRRGGDATPPAAQAVEIMRWLKTRDLGPDTGLSRAEIEADLYDEAGLPR